MIRQALPHEEDGGSRAETLGARCSAAAACVVRSFGFSCDLFPDGLLFLHCFNTSAGDEIDSIPQGIKEWSPAAAGGGANGIMMEKENDNYADCFVDNYVMRNFVSTSRARNQSEISQRATASRGH